MYSIGSFIREIPIIKSEKKSDIIACLLVLGVRKYAEGNIFDLLNIVQDILFLGDWREIYEYDLMEKAFFLSIYAKGITNYENENKCYEKEYKKKLFDIIKVKKKCYRNFFSSWNALEINTKIKKDMLYRLKGGVLNELKEDLVFYGKGDKVFLFVLKVEEILESIYLHYVNRRDLSVEIEKAKKGLLEFVEKTDCLPPYCDFDI